MPFSERERKILRGYCECVLSVSQHVALLNVMLDRAPGDRLTADDPDVRAFLHLDPDPCENPPCPGTYSAIVRSEDCPLCRK